MTGRGSKLRNILLFGVLIGSSISLATNYDKFLSFKGWLKQKSIKGKEVDDFDFLDILHEIVDELYDQLYEMSQTSHRLLINLKEKDMLRLISNEEIKNLILNEEFLQYFTKTSDDIIQKRHPHWDTPKFWQEFKAHASHDDNIMKNYLSMFDEIPEGKIPIHPFYTDVIHKYVENNEDKVYECLINCLRAKRIALTEIFSDPQTKFMFEESSVAGFIPTPELSEIIKNRCNDADEKVIKSSQFYLDIVQKESSKPLNYSILHRSSVGYMCRMNESFAEKRLLLINQHTEQINAIIATNNVSEIKETTDVKKENVMIDPDLQSLAISQ